jgi:hypothetical protein
MEGQSMVTRKVLASLAAAGLVIGSTAASAAPAARSEARASSPVASSEGLVGGWHWFLLLLIVAGVIGVIAAGNNEDVPHSP